MKRSRSPTLPAPEIRTEDASLSGTGPKPRALGAGPAPIPSRRARILALLVCLALALLWTLPLEAERSWGWDESMHAELPAARMLVSALEGDFGGAFEALHDCAQYPFVYPLVLAAVQLATGISEHAARVTGTLVWVAALYGLFLLGAEVARARAERRAVPGRPLEIARGDGWIPWFALALGALSPLALAYAGTLFLEVPFACAAVFTLRAWLVRERRGEDRLERRRDLAAGAWIAVAFFTKFNYGLLLALGLGLDWLVQGVAAARAGGLQHFVRRSAWLALIPLATLAWWFVLPLPEGFEVAREHRTAFAEFLQGNQALTGTPWERRVLFASYFAGGPRALVLILLAALASLAAARERAVRLLWLVLLAMAVPTEAHPFHLDRFLIPCGAALWPLAAVGLARTLPRQRFWRTVFVALLASIVFASPRADTLRLAESLGQTQADPFVRAYMDRILASWCDLRGSRALPTAGLERAPAERLLDAIAAEVGPEERVAWIGMSSELSPAALQLGLLVRGGTRARFLEETRETLDVDYFGDPGWDSAELARFVERFDVVLYCEPVDLKRRGNREALSGYVQRLKTELGWRARELAHVDLLTPLQDPYRVRLHACRRATGP